jgi:hypothetical protein
MSKEGFLLMVFASQNISAIIRVIWTIRATADKLKFPTISEVVHGENAHLTLDTGDDAPCSGNDSYCPDHDDISHQGAIEDILGLVFGQMLAAFDGSSVPVNNELKELTEPLYEADGDLSSAREIRIQSIQAVHGSVYARAYLHSYNDIAEGRYDPEVRAEAFCISPVDATFEFLLDAG